jgi:hypothetical protein
MNRKGNAARKDRKLLLAYPCRIPRQPIHDCPDSSLGMGSSVQQLAPYSGAEIATRVEHNDVAALKCVQGF